MYLSIAGFVANGNCAVQNDTEKLIIHGRFLEDKFRKDDLLATTKPS